MVYMTYGTKAIQLAKMKGAFVTALFINYCISYYKLGKNIYYFVYVMISSMLHNIVIES